ncbi:hypothetical protein PQR14_11640 [Paraburkholderia bryophila]|uniref:hypothetical protein n=1 Tax=Paraburkholderia bryophila TaxID=420952 RepID=UPI0038BAFFEE
MRHISLQVTQLGIKSPACVRVLPGEADAIRRELIAHNEVQRARYRAQAARIVAMQARQQGKSHLVAAGVA